MLSNVLDCWKFWFRLLCTITYHDTEESADRTVTPFLVSHKFLFWGQCRAFYSGPKFSGRLSLYSVSWWPPAIFCSVTLLYHPILPSVLPLPSIHCPSSSSSSSTAYPSPLLPPPPPSSPPILSAVLLRMCISHSLVHLTCTCLR